MSLPTALRDLPPVEPVELPSRLSMTFLRHFDVCKRSAYLYTRHRGGAPSHALDRGTAFHHFAEKAVRLMVEQEEERLPPELAKDLMVEVVREHPELTVPAAEQDRLRLMAYHFAEGVWIDPARVVAVERKFVFDIGGWKVVGKLDFASLSEDGAEAEIIDWKTAWAMTPEEELSSRMPDGRRASKAAQLVIYALLFAFGQPEAENGTLEPPLGDRVQAFQLSEVYPQYLFDDGLGRRSSSVTRAELMDHRLWLEGLVEQAGGAFESWKFPAVVGSHCATCPAPLECPLPGRLRAHRGEVNSLEQAAEAAERLHVEEADVKARKKELRNLASHLGPIRYGADRVMDFAEAESRSTDWDGLRAAVDRAREYGEPLNFDDHVKRSTSTRFRDRKLTAEELAEETSDNGQSPAERWGDDAPW